MTIRILLNGATGKMGQSTVKTIQANSDFDLVATPTRQEDLNAAIKASKPDVVIDFTNAEAVFKNSKIILDAGVRPVIGTSGLRQNEIAELQSLAKTKKLGGIIAPNFSLGAVLLMKHSREIVKYFPHVEVIEMHHNKKADSPSGTSMRTAEMLAEQRQIPNDPQTKRENVPGARGATYQSVPIHSIRLPGVMAHEQVIFGAIGETLTLSHNSIDRECFMPGVCLAVRKVMELNQLVYGLEEILTN